MDTVELARLLRGARGRVKPSDHGFAPREERRGRSVVGLSQAQVDHLLLMRSWPVGTYGRLERGKLEPTTDLLDAIAGILQLDDHECSALYLYAGHQSALLSLQAQAPVQVGENWQLALDGVEHMAYITDYAWTLVRWNRHFPGLFAAPGDESAAPPANIMRWMMLSRAAREDHLMDWATAWAPFALAQLRIAVRQYPHSQVLRQLHRDVLADPLTGPIYNDPSLEYTHPDGDCRPLRHAVLGPGMVTMCPSYLPGSRATFMIIPFQPGPVEPHRNHGRVDRGQAQSKAPGVSAS